MKKVILFFGLCLSVLNAYSQSNSPTLREIFDFEVGDIFLYRGEEGDGSLGPDQEEPSYWYAKYEIEHKYISGDTLMYIRSFDSYVDTLIYVDSVNHPLNRYSDDIVLTIFPLYGSCCQPDTFFSRLSIFYTVTLGDTLYYKAIGAEMYEYNDGVYNGVPVSDKLFEQWYGKGIGLAKQSFADFELGSSIELIGYRKGGDTTGILGFESRNYSDDLLAGVYPNPFRDNLHISLNNNSEITKVELFSSSGVLLQTFLTVAASIEIQTSEWKPGIYLLRVSNKKARVNRKIVKVE